MMCIYHGKISDMAIKLILVSPPVVMCSSWKCGISCFKRFFFCGNVLSMVKILHRYHIKVELLCMVEHLPQQTTQQHHLHQIATKEENHHHDHHNCIDHAPTYNNKMSSHADEDINADDGSTASVILSFIAGDSNEEYDTFFSCEECLDESDKPRTFTRRSNITVVLNKIKGNSMMISWKL